MSVTRMSARRSAEALAPISSHLRSRSPPQASPIIEKRRASTRTPSVRKEASVASERKRSHIYNDDYETSETVRKRPNTSIPASAKKRSAAKPRPKQSSAAKEAKATPTRTRKSVPKLPRSAAVGLDEIEADRAYGKDSIDSEDIDEEESPVEKTVHKVVSRAAYEKSLKEPSPSKTLDSAQKSATKEVDGVDGMDIEQEHPALIDDSITPHYVTTDSYNIGSEDESHMDSDYPGDNIPCRDEDGADADVEDEDEEDEDDEEDDAVPAPYDSGVLTEMETEYVEEEIGEVEELEDEVEDEREVEGEGDEGEVGEDGDEGEGEGDEVEEEDEDEGEENRENVDDHDEVSEKEVLGDVVEIDDDAISSDYLSELEADAEEDDGEGYANAMTTFRAQIGDDDEVVDLVSSDEEVLEEEEEEEEEEDGAVEADEDSECDSFLTADSNDPNLPSTVAIDTDSLALVPVVLKKEVTKQDTVADAVNTVLSAFKNSLSAKDFEQLQLIMSKEVKISETTLTDKTVAAQEQDSEMLDDEPDERTGSRKRMEAVSRLSGDGTSWASRESFQPTSPYDRFSSTMSSILSLPSASNGVSGEKVDSSADNTLSHLTRWNNTVRFEDKANEFRERSSLSSGSSSHIKYGPVTFMRRPMTPFARKMAASPSPLGSSYSNHPADPMSSSRGVGQFSGFKSRPQYMDADVPFPSSDGILRKRGHEESMSHSDSIDDRDQGGSKRLNLGQSAYSVRSAEQSRRSLTAPDSRFSNQDSRFIQNGGQEGQSFAHGSVAQGPRTSSSVYTPMYTDNKSRGTFTGVLLQPSQQQSQSQSQARRASFSFSQRRKLTRKSEGSIFSNSNSSSLAAPISSTSSAYASASVAKKILDTLSELQTPIEEARHRPIAVNSAIRASSEAIARSERLAAEPVAPKSTGNATLKADPSPGSFSWAFPSVPSVGLAAVAAATATTSATATATIPASSTLSFSFPASKSAPIATETARSTNKIPAITTTAPAHLTPSFSQSSPILKTPRTPNNVRFAAQDSEFTFGDPSEVEGVDSSEIERVLSTPGSKRNEKIRFAFSPPGKAMMSSEKGRTKATPQEVTKETPKPLATTPAVIPATSSGESLWTKAASAAQDYQKCAVCFVQNSNTATKCLSCESSLKGAGQGAAAVVAPKSAPAAGESLWTKAASAAQDYQKCAVCFVQNSNTATKCLSCESSLKGSGQAVTAAAAAAAPVQSATVTIPAFSFGSAPVASKTATVTAEVPIPTSTPWGTAPHVGPTKDFSGSFSMQPSSAQTAVSTVTPLPGGFSFGAPAAAPAAATGGATGFSITPSGTTGFTFGGTSTAPAPAAVSSAAAAPSLVMPPASASFGGFFTGPAAVPSLASNPFSTSSSTVSAPSSSAAATSFPATLPASTTKKETVGFQFGAPTSATPSVTPAATAAPASAATFKGFSSITSPATVTGASEKPQIAFGDSIGTRPNTSLPPTTTSAPFSFGSLPSTTPTTTTIAPFSFGKSETVSAPTSSTPAPAPFMFGSVPAVKPVESAPSFTASPSPFQFGSMNPTPVPAFSATPAFSFDSSSAPAPFRFGASASTLASTPALASPFPSIVSAQGTSTAFGVDSPNSTMDTGYMSGDASNIGFPPALSSTSFGSAPAPFSFGAPAMSSGTMGSQLPPFGTSSQPFGGGSAPFASSNSSQPFTFGALPQPQSQPQSQSQPQFGYAPGIAGASGMFAQPLAAAPSPAFSFDTSRGGGMAPQGMQSMGPSGGGGGFSMGASDNGNRKKVRAKRPGGQ